MDPIPGSAFIHAKAYIQQRRLSQSLTTTTIINNSPLSQIRLCTAAQTHSLIHSHPPPSSPPTAPFPKHGSSATPCQFSASRLQTPPVKPSKLSASPPISCSFFPTRQVEETKKKKRTQERGMKPQIVADNVCVHVDAANTNKQQ